jgi:hypothetical protein
VVQTRGRRPRRTFASSDLRRLAIYGCVALAVVVVFTSNHVILWMAALAVASALFAIIGHFPPLLWIVAYSWLAVAADILRADVAGRFMLPKGADLPAGDQQEAIIISLAALTIMAVGMRLAFSPNTDEEQEDSPLNLKHAAFGYLGSVIVAGAAGSLSAQVPSIALLLLPLSNIKYVFVFLISFEVYRRGQGYILLVPIMLAEVVIGLTGFFADYKNALFIMIIASLQRRIKIQPKILLAVAATMAVLCWVSLVWTSIKMEYRYGPRAAVALPLGDRITWIFDRMASGGIDYEASAGALLDRLGYTSFYAVVIGRMDANAIPKIEGQWISGVTRVLMPRLLFPEKSAINDSANTTLLTGMPISEGTSMSVGYVAQAHVDFGFPWMFVPLTALGFCLGKAGRFVMSRQWAYQVRLAVATVCLYDAFNYGLNFDQALGAFLMNCIVLVSIFGFMEPRLSNWLRDDGAISRRSPLELP